jgi:hypothetical protein
MSAFWQLVAHRNSQSKPGAVNILGVAPTPEFILPSVQPNSEAGLTRSVVVRALGSSPAVTQIMIALKVMSEVPNIPGVILWVGRLPVVRVTPLALLSLPVTRCLLYLILTGKNADRLQGFHLDRLTPPNASIGVAIGVNRWSQHGKATCKKRLTHMSTIRTRGEVSKGWFLLGSNRNSPTTTTSAFDPTASESIERDYPLNIGVASLLRRVALSIKVEPINPGVTA